MPDPPRSDEWKRLVLEAMVPPAWLSENGPERDVVLSTRVRLMRNLRGKRFPHAAAASELRDISQALVSAFPEGHQVLRSASPAERDYLVACRLVSPDFDWHGPGRALVTDDSRSLCAMINEEDHLRLQALTAGWSLGQAKAKAESVLEALSQKLDFARSERFGYLAASPENCGAGLRYSAMFHLVGLAQNKRLPTVIRALGAQGLVVRGLFGERSRAIGALTQVSTTGSSVAPFVGACDYLLKEERRARAGLTVVELGARQEELRRFVESAKALSLADSLRAMGWQRWLAGKGADAHEAARQVDALIPSLALSEGLGEPRAGRARADLMRSLLRAG